MKYFYPFLLLIAVSSVGHAQVGIGTLLPNESSQLDVVATDKGVLIPRIKLTSTLDHTTITKGNVDGLLVFNTITNDDVTPGFYYWLDDKWNRIANPSDLRNKEITSVFTNIQGKKIRMTVNEVDLKLALGAATTNSVKVTGKNLTTTVNGVTSTVDLVKTLESVTSVSNELMGTELSTTVNGVTGDAVDLSPILMYATNNELILSGQNLTSFVNGVSSTIDLSPALTSVTTNELTSDGNTITSNVNGVSKTVPTINTIVNTLDGKNLKTTINGVAGNAIDLAPALAAATTHELEVKGNTITTNVNGVSKTAAVVNEVASKLAGKNLTTSVNGVLSTIDLTPALETTTTVTNELKGKDLTTIVNGVKANTVDLTEVLEEATTVSNELNGTELSTTVNGVTGDGVDLSPLLMYATSNELILTGKDLTSVVNGVSSTVDLTPALGSITTNELSSSGNTITSNVNGVSKTAPAVSAVVNTLDGKNLVTSVNGVSSTVDLTPALESATTVSNTLDGKNLTTIVNGVSAKAVDLTPALAVATTNELSSSGNTITSNVNGVSKTAPAVNAVANTLDGKDLTTIVNGVAGNTIDLTPALIIATTNKLKVRGKDLTTTVNGISSTVDLTETLESATTVYNELLGTELTTTVNGVTGDPTDLAPLLTYATINELSLKGKDLISIVNGVSGSVDLTPALESLTTNELSSTGNAITSNVNGVSKTALAVNTVSTTLAGKDLTTSVNGVAGNTIDLTKALESATTVSNALDGKNLTTTVNGITGNIVDLTPALAVATTNELSSTGNAITSNVNGVSKTALAVNSNTTALSGTNLTTTVNGVESAALNLAPVVTAATTNVFTSSANIITSNVNGKSVTANAVNSNALTATNGNLVSTVNGVASTPVIAIVSSANNGLTRTNGNVALGGSLTAATVITTTATNTLRVAGLTATTTLASDDIIVANATGVLKKTPVSAFLTSSWGFAGNAGTATSFLGTTNNQPLRFRSNNTEKMTILANGRTGIGKTTPTYALEVVSPTNDELLGSFLPNNSTQGVAIGLSGISKIGTAANSDFKISPKGTGNINLDGPVAIKTLPEGTAGEQIVVVDESNNLKKIDATSVGKTYTAKGAVKLIGTEFSVDNANAQWNANKLHGKNIYNVKAPTTGQVLTYDGLEWVYKTPVSTEYKAASPGITLSGTTFSVPNTTAQWNANQLLGKTLNSVTPASNQVLTYNGSEWVPRTPIDTKYTAVSPGIKLTGTSFSVPNTTAQWNANQLQGKAIATTAPTTNQVLAYNGTDWKATTLTATSPGIKLTGTTFSVPNTTAQWNANLLQGRTVATTTPSTNQVLRYNGSSWTPATLTDADTRYYAASPGISLSGTTFSVPNTTAQWNASQLRGKGISTATPTTGQVLSYNGTEWRPTTPLSTTYSASGDGIKLSGTTFSVPNTTAQWNANQLLGKALKTERAYSGNILVYNGTSWESVTLAGSNRITVKYTSGNGIIWFDANHNDAWWNADKLVGKSLGSGAQNPKQNDYLVFRGGVWTAAKLGISSVTVKNVNGTKKVIDSYDTLVEIVDDQQTQISNQQKEIDELKAMVKALMRKK